MEILLFIALLSFAVAIVSHYWIVTNEFYEWKFPEIKKFSIISGQVTVVLALIIYIISNINITIEIKQSRERFINPYSQYRLYRIVDVELFEDVDKIVFTNQAKYRIGSYKIRARKVNEQIALDLKNIREKNPDTLIKWFGTDDIDINYVYSRDLNQDIVNAPDTKETYTFEFYYTDINKREAWTEEYRDMINKEYSDWSEPEREQLLKSFVAQADLDRAFDITKTFEVSTDEGGNLIITDEMKGFISKKRLDVSSGGASSTLDEIINVTSEIVKDSSANEDMIDKNE